MKLKYLALALATFCFVAGADAQPKRSKKAAEEKKASYEFTTVKTNPITSIKNQNRSGTCWSFSTIAFLESEAIKKGTADTSLNLAPMFPVYKCYVDKADKYVRMDGTINFGGGGAANDVTYVLKNYGMVPESAMNGLNYGEEKHVHGELDALTKAYVDVIVKNPNRKLSPSWKVAYEGIIKAYLGTIPEKFSVKGKEYTPMSYAKALNLNADDYVEITSYTHHPFYTQFILEVADNWQGSKYYNVPMNEMMEIVDNALENGYTIAWGTDVSEKGFTRDGIGIIPDVEANEKSAGSDQARWVGANKEDKNATLYNLNAPGKEKVITQEMRQQAFDSKETTDDHGMQIFGIAKDQNGTKYYMVKNSWSTNSKYKGIWYVSVPFVQYKTMDIMINKAAIPDSIKAKLGIK
jgi:aminopeptidase C